MKQVIVSAAMLAALATGALAQASLTPAPPPTARAATGPVTQAPPPPPPGPGSVAEAGPATPPPEGPHGHRPPPPPPGKAAHFRLDRGDTALDVKCAEDEPMKACADIALQLLDRMQAAPKP